jgi:hypothetical protein
VRVHRGIATAVAALALAAAPAVAQAAFPGSDPDESVRVNTPDDPAFDHCESDDEQGADCSNVFDEEYERFGFAPDASEHTALYKNPLDTARQQEQNLEAGRNPLGQIPGVSADRAWKRSTGRPDVRIAILDTGIRWRERSLRRKVALNTAELPKPDGCDAYDCDSDGAVTVDDYADDPRVQTAAGNDEADDILDASDLIAVFSDGTDADGNGYADDIAGWDFFDDDNDPYDASSYSSASNHGTGRAQEAGQETDEGVGGTGVCPECQIVPVRVWDTFVTDTNQFALGLTYAADDGIRVVEAALGGLTNTSFARAAARDAYARGVFMAVVSSDLNTANHNFPTTYDEAMMVAGTVADVQGLGSSDAEVGGFLGDLGIPTSAPIATWFRNSGTTQYGGHGHIVMPAVTGSAATGQAAGAAGLVASYGLEEGYDLAPNEIKQLITQTAEDVVPENTLGTGTPDPAQKGWDQHFGYGRPDLGLALERIAQGRIPPQALITSPDWFAPLALERGQRVDIGGRVSARGGGVTYRVEWAPGIEPAESEFRTAAVGTGATDGHLASIDLRAVRAALDARPGGGAANDPTAPQKGAGDTDPNEPAFTVRVRATDAAGTRGEDRKVLFAYRDATLAPGWPRTLAGGGEASQRLWDVDGDNQLDVVQAESSGTLTVLRADGSTLPGFPVRTRPLAAVHPGAPAYTRMEAPLEPLRTPAIGDIDGDRRAEIVDTAGEHVYAWEVDGTPVGGFPVRLDPDFSRPEDRTRENHVKRGFFAAPVLADLTGGPALEIVASAMDQHVYAFDGSGTAVPGWPVKLRDPSLPGAEIITAPAAGDITGDGRPELVTPTQEFDDAAQAPEGDLPSLLRSGLTNILANAAGGSGRTYALDASGHVLPGWPVKPNGAVPDALPLVGPGVEHAMADVDGDGKLEVIGNVASGDVQVREGDGQLKTTLDPAPATGDHADKSRVLNLFEHPIAADLDGRPGVEILKGGLTLNGLVNLGIAVGQNLPYNHVLQAWDATTGGALAAFPQAVEDYQLLSSPAVADVGGGAEREAIVGTGLYLLRALTASGQEPAGFPKFTGGWLYAVPAAGDVDGDGRLDIAAVTREGRAFLWRTGRPACGGNGEWWTSRHDERSTGAHGTDTRPPGTARNRAATFKAAKVQLAWTPPGDDWLCGTPAHYEVRDAAGSVVASGTSGGDAAVPDRKGDVFTIAYADEAGNWGLPAQFPAAR